MPSAHSAFVAATAWSVGLLEGFDSALFAVAAVFAGIVMFDAQGVRWAASRQARILNQIVDQLFQGQPIGEERLKELLGHTPYQVFAGAAIGVFIAWVIVRR
jgi:acid phosphatase family membrane protein YuiD